MSDQDLVTLYSTRVLALATDIPHLGRLGTPDASARCRSPLCGSTVTVDVSLTGGRVTAFAQEVRTCALGQASAALLGTAAVGLDLAELQALRTVVRAMLENDGPAPATPFAGYEVLRIAHGYRNRHASILLPLDAICEATAAAATGTATRAAP